MSTEYVLQLAAKGDGSPPILYEFRAHGPNEDRMRRALCFYDNALFNGLQRAELLDDGFRSDPTRPSGMLHASIIKAYRHISKLLASEEVCIRIAAARVNTDLLRVSPIVTTLNVFPKSVRYGDIYSCDICCKVFDQNADETVCPTCR